MKILSGISLILILFACRGKHTEPVKSELQMHADIARLHRELNRHFTHISDSGTLNNEILNDPDSLKIWFQNPATTEKWMGILFSDQFKNITALEKLLRMSGEHGLNDSFYHRQQIASYLARVQKHSWDSIVPYDSLSHFLLLAADGAAGFANDMYGGRVNPSYTGSVDVLPKRQLHHPERILFGENFISELKKMIPDFEPYNAMQQEYKRLLNYDKRQLGNQVYLRKRIYPGDSLSKYEYTAIYKKLRMHGVLNALPLEEPIGGRYSDDMVYSVMKLQKRYELKITGIIDKNILQYMNITRDSMLRGLQANLERWRWIGAVKESDRIWVNIASNRLSGFQNDTLKLDMKVCSGKARDTAYYNKLKRSKEDPDLPVPDNMETPLMKATLTHLVVNPSWFVPKNIMTREILPHLKSNKNYLKENNYRLLNSKGEELDPDLVDWSQVTAKSWKYRLEQLPGNENSLGKIVIHFPNPYSIFMHDTPAKNAFTWRDRHVSHGCVRMDTAMKMAQFISGFQKKNTTDDIYISAGLPPVLDKKRIKKYEEDLKDSVKAKKYDPKPNRYYKSEIKIPVYIVYFTCDVKPNGIVFFEDSYHRDAKLLMEMKRPLKRVQRPSISVSAQTFSP